MQWFSNKNWLHFSKLLRTHRHHLSALCAGSSFEYDYISKKILCVNYSAVEIFDDWAMFVLARCVR